MNSPRFITALAAAVIVLVLVLMGRRPDVSVLNERPVASRVLPDVAVPGAVQLTVASQSTSDVPLRASVLRLVDAMDRGVPVQLTVDGEASRTLLLRPRKLLADNFRMTLGVGDEGERVLDPQMVRTYSGRGLIAGGRLGARVSVVVVDSAIAAVIEEVNGDVLQVRTDAQTGELLTLAINAGELIGTCEHDERMGIASTFSEHEPFTDEDWLASPRAVLAVVDANDPEVLNAGGVNPANGRLDKYVEPLPLGQNYALSLRDLVSLIVLDKGSTGANTTSNLTTVASEYLARMANVASVHEHQLGVRTLVQELILTPNTAEFVDVPATLDEFRTWVGNNRPRGTYLWNNAAKFDGTTGGAIGIAYVGALNGGSGVSINNRGYTHALVAHEMGHNMGTGHSDGGIMNPSIITGSRDFFRDVSAGETAAKDIYDYSQSRLYGSAAMRHPEQIPFAADDDRTTAVNTVHVFNPIANDANVVANGTASSVLTLEEVSVVQPLNAGTVEISGPNEVTFTPATGFQGISYFSYSVRGDVGNGGNGWLHKGDATVQVGTWNADSLNISLAPGQVFSMRPSGGGNPSIQSQPANAYVGTSRDDRLLIIIRAEAGAVGTDSFVFQKNGVNSTVNITYLPVSEYLVATPDVFFAEGSSGTITFDPLVNDQGGGYRFPVSINPILNGSNPAITYYFRKRFDVADPAVFTGLNLELLRDDGAVVYLNGAELTRDNMPAGTIAFDALASASVGGTDETSYFPFNNLPKTALVAGSNVLAVEIHQSSLTSSDVSFDLSLTGVKTSGNEVLVARSANWRYLDNGSDQGTAWREAAFNDNGGLTLLSYGPDASSKYVTTYFRRQFQVANSAAVSALELRIRRDDGAVVYLNGSEVARSNMPTGPITYQTLASAGAPDDGADFQVISLSSAGLLTGSNTLAVEIHQSALTSSDITFDLELLGTTAGGVVRLVTPGAIWKYLDSGSNQNTAWRALEFNDAAWVSGPAPLGYPVEGAVWAEGGAILGFGDGNEVTTLNDAGDGLVLLPGAFRVVSATNLTTAKGMLTFNETRPFTINGASTNVRTGLMSFTPATGATGIAQIEYVIEDGVGNQTTGTVTIVLPLVEILSPVADEIIMDITNGLQLSAQIFGGGLPPLSGTVTPAWTVVSTPAGGSAIFEDPASKNTVVRFTVAGEYVIQLTGTDNGLSTSEERIVKVLDSALGEGSDGLLAWWKLDETAGTTHADASGNGHVGTRVNNPAFTSGIIDGAISFDATNRYVDLSSHVADFKDLAQGTISVWFQTTTGSTRTIFSASDSGDANSDLRFYIDTGRLKYKLRGDVGTSEGSISSPGTVNDGEWHHAAVTVDAAQNATLYLDGEVVATGIRAFFSGVFDIDSMSIGRVERSNASAEPFSGKVDDLRIYQRILAAEEVADMAGVLKNHAPLVTLPRTQPTSGAASISTAFLNPSTSDDGLPGAAVSVQWQSVAGPGMAVFSNANALITNVTFPAAGLYTLRLIAGDGEATTVDDIQILYTAAGNGVPFALGIPDRVIFQNAPDTLINLFDVFADGQDPDSGLNFTITGNTNVALFDSVSVTGGSPKVLTINYAAGAEGESVLKIRATDTGGLFVETSFRVTVENFRPSILAQILTVAEDAAGGDVVGTINASDSDGDSVSFAIIKGNESGDFVLEQATGRLKVSPTAVLDFETKAGYSFVVAVTDAKHQEFTTTANVSINVSDVNEAPRMANQFLNVDAAAANGSAVGALAASDPEGHQLALAITGGNTSNAFGIDAGTGNLVVNNSAAITINSQQFVLSVTATDDESPGLSHTAEVRVTVAEMMVAEGAAARAFVPTSAAVDSTWFGSVFNDAAWTGGVTGVGFDTDVDYVPLIGIDLETELSGVNGTVYIRIPFTATNPAALGAMELGMKYDDGFVAYLNGQEIARRNAPAGLAWNALATAGHDDDLAQVSELIDVSQHLGKLVAGNNVLAIHGMNNTIGSSDLLILPTLTASASGTAGSPIPASVSLQSVTSVTEDSALLRASVVSTGGSNPTLTFVWGRKDGGNDLANWENSNVSAPRPVGSFNYSVSGLSPGQTYFYNVIASNIGGTVTGGDALTFTTELGDPTVLIPEGAMASGFVPTNASVVDGIWRERGFDDSIWSSGTMAAGYEDGSGYQALIGNSLDFKTEMLNKNASLYVRVAFVPANPTGIQRLVLRMKYDDGFVAWLNGIELARRNAFEGTPIWNSGASGQHPDGEATVFEDIDISGFVGLLSSGVNVLSMHGLNDGVDSSDMLISAELLGYSTGTGPVQFYDDWASENALSGSGALTKADLDGDGLTNLAEYAFDTDPKAADGDTHLVDLAVNGRLRVSYVRRTDAAARGLTYRVDASAALGDWQPAVIEAVESVQPNVGGATEIVTVRIGGSGGVQFARVVVTLVP
jgi:hypothetical protein